MNPLLNGVSPIPNIGQLKNMFQMIQYARNPQAMLNKLIENSPNGKDIMEYVKSFNGDYEKAFLTKAKEMGIDPNDFLNNFK